jgi:Xaa-Pro aminopeptidase
MSIKNGKRIERIRNQDQFKAIDALLIKKPENILYLLGFHIESETEILFPNTERIQKPSKILIFVNALEYDEVKSQIKERKDLDDAIKLIKISREDKDVLKKKIKQVKLDSLGFEDDFISVKAYNQMNEKYKNVNLIGASEILNEARLIKTEREINQMRRASELGIIGFRTIYEEIKEGMTEKELATRAEFAMKKAGADAIAFKTIVASGERSAFPHAKTSEYHVHKGDIILVDIGANYNGYCSDMTRTFLFDANNSKYYSKKAELINLVNEGQKKGLEKIKPGVKASEVDKTVRKFFKKEHKEWGERFIHSLGHGVGIEVHEKPYISEKSEDVLKEGMCLTIEPGLYIEGLGGARTEDLIVITGTGYECLTSTEKFYY